MTMTLVSAGVDTMSWTLVTVIAGICGSPRVYAQVMQELLAASQSGDLSRGQPVQYEAAIKLAFTKQ
jgi:hypothetical protein